MADPTSALSALRVLALNATRDALDAAGSALIETGARLQTAIGMPSLVAELREERDRAVAEAARAPQPQSQAGAVRYLETTLRGARAVADDLDRERHDAARAIDVMISRLGREPVGDDDGTTLLERLGELDAAADGVLRQASDARQAAARLEASAAWLTDELRRLRVVRDDLDRELRSVRSEVWSALDDLDADEPGDRDDSVSELVVALRTAIAEREESHALEVSELRAKLGTRKALVA
jgi:hypothetical protein